MSPSAGLKREMKSRNPLIVIAERYQAIINYFIPERLKLERDTENQARMFLISHTMGPILGNSVPLALYMFDPTPGFDTIILSLSITSFWIFPILLKKGFTYDGLVIASVINLNFAIYWSCFFNGGVASPTLPWLLIIPILSLFYIGGDARLQKHLLAVSALSFVGFLGAYLVLSPDDNDIPLTAMQGLGIVSTIAALAYVATMAIYYSRIFDAGLELESEVRRRREITDQLREAVTAADRSGAMKTEFLARMSHELRTPLNAVIGYSELIKEDVHEIGDYAMEADVDRIHDAGIYLLRLINMILDLAKLEAGRLAFDLKPHDLREVLVDIISSNRAEAKTRGNVIDLEVGPGLEEVLTDDMRLKSIIECVVANAVHYTKDGTITVSARRIVDDVNPDRFEIQVSDTGRGIEPEQLATLFETFVAKREASDTRYGGTGLNLTVTKRLCNAMGGEITVDSELGKGSTFAIQMFVDPSEEMSKFAERAANESREKLNWAA